MDSRDVEGGTSQSPTSSDALSTPPLQPALSTCAKATRTRSRASAASRTVGRTLSQNGYGVSDEMDEPGDGDDPNSRAEKDRYEVGFDGGDRDPLCPRSFSKARKWMITFIVSACSFCV